jgi:hypothetical protein
MAALKEFCQAQKITLPDKYHELEMALREFFVAGEFFSPGLVIDGYGRRVGWDLIFMLHAYPHQAPNNDRVTPELPQTSDLGVPQLHTAQNPNLSEMQIPAELNKESTPLQLQ